MPDKDGKCSWCGAVATYDCVETAQEFCDDCIEILKKGEGIRVVLGGFKDVGSNEGDLEVVIVKEGETIQ